MLTIHADKPVAKVSPTLYGLMTEEINYSYDGGLYAEMVQQPDVSQRSWTGPQHWFLVQKGDCAGEDGAGQDDRAERGADDEPEADVEQADAASPAGVANDGWWGYAGAAEYDLHGIVLREGRRCRGGPGDGEPGGQRHGQGVATATVPALTTDWKKYKFTLKTGAVTTSRPTTLLLTVDHPGTVWLQPGLAVSADVSRIGANGNRIDLMEMLAAMHPAVPALAGRQLSGRRPQSRTASTGRRPSGRWWIGRRIRVRGAITRPTAWDCWSFWSGART